MNNSHETTILTVILVLLALVVAQNFYPEFLAVIQGASESINPKAIEQAARI